MIRFRCSERLRWAAKKCRHRVAEQCENVLKVSYREETLDEERHVLLLRVYFKGDREDLSPQDYRCARQESDDVLQDVLSHDFRDVDPPAP